MYVLTKEDVWPEDRWREALHAWSDEKHLKRSWLYMAPILVNAPDEVLQSLAHNVSGWLQDISKTFEAHKAYFFTLSDRILELDFQDDGDTDDAVRRAINHPVGHVTEALLRWWDQRPLEDGQGLSGEIKPTFTRLCDTGIGKFRNARVLLAAHVIALFRVDQGWTKQHLLPLFDWQRSQEEARAAWQGFLWSPQLYRPLMEKFKPAFLDTAKYYEELGEYGRQYASLLTFAALDRGDTFTTSELKAATRSLSPNGLNDAAQALVNALESADESASARDQRANYWQNRVAPYLRAIWPNTRDRLSPDISESLGLLCVAAQEAFPEALDRLRVWLQLQPPPYPGRLVHRLYKADLCGRFPEQALEFLNLVIGDQAQRPPGDLSACLDAIQSASPELEADPRFIALKDYLRWHEQG